MALMGKMDKILVMAHAYIVSHQSLTVQCCTTKNNPISVFRKKSLKWKSVTTLWGGRKGPKDLDQKIKKRKNIFGVSIKFKPRQG